MMILAGRLALAAPPVAGSEDDLAMAPHAAWIRAQQNRLGQLCCSVADARPVDVRTHDGHWQVRFVRPAELPEPHPYGWQDVPDSAVLRDGDGQPVASPAGLSLAWWYGGEVRCFTVPTGG